MPKPDHRKRATRRITPGTFVALVALLALPSAAAFRLDPLLNFRWVLGYWLIVSAVTYALYGADKKKAELGEWRTPESTLHFCDLIGGWAAGFLAQREFRHKTSKRSFQSIFWTIVLLHQLVACAFLLQWTVSRKIWWQIQHSGAWAVIRTFIS